MQNQYLIDMLDILDEKLKEEFLLFLEGCTDKNKNDLLKFARILSVKDVNKGSNAIFSEIFPGEAFESGKVVFLRHRLHKQLQNFLNLKYLETHPIQKEINVVGFLFERNFQNISERYLRRIQKKIEKASQSFAGPLDFEMVFKFKQLELEKNLVVNSRGTQLNYEETIEAFDLYVNLQLLELYSAKINYSKIAGKVIPECDFQRIQGILENLKDHQDLYYHLIVQLQLPDREQAMVAFQSLREKLACMERGTNHKDQVDAYFHLLNFCTRNINNREFDFLEEFFQLVEEIWKKGLFEIINQPGALAKNLILLGLREKKLERAVGVFEKLKNVSNGAISKMEFSFCEGMIQFHASDFLAAESSFKNCIKKKGDIFVRADARVFLLKIYFELGTMPGYDDLFDKELNNFRLFYSRTGKFSREHLQHYGNFYKSLQALNNVRFVEDRALIQKAFKAEIRSKRISENCWIALKFQELLKTITPAGTSQGD
ncbi:MAG: hypothetical protein H6581_24660 [Bacteroidia bacterium]|nr:hypothetical protein [Bacteroidia bacterium]